MKSCCVWIISIAAVASGAARAADVPASVEPTLIVNYRRVAPGLATAGQITPEGLAQLKRLGFVTIVNLRTAPEGAEAEGVVVKAEGLRYVWVPVTADTLSLADVRAVRAVLDDRKAAPVLLHCASANRVGAVWAILQVQRGRDVEAALEEARAIGLKPGAMTATLERVLAELKAGAAQR